MSAPEALSFRLRTRLALSLGWVGGYVNVVTLLSCGALVSHVTGNITHAVADVPLHRLSAAWFAALLVAGFFAGAVVAALLLEYARLQGRASRYVAPLAIEMGLLTTLWVRLRAHGHAPLPDGDPERMRLALLAAVAMGLQNATISRISGSVVRTTHVTGVVTDLGIESVRLWSWFRQRRDPGRLGRTDRLFRAARMHDSATRLAILGSLLGSFVLGSLAAAWAYPRWPDVALALPIAFLAWMVFVDWRTPILAAHQTFRR